MRRAGALIALVAIAGGMVWLLAPGGSDAPSILERPEHGWIVAVDPGAVFTDGLELLSLEGEGDVTIRAIRFTGDREVELAGALLAPPDVRKYAWVQYDPSFPPTDPDFGRVAEFSDAIGYRMVAPSAASPEGDEFYGYQLVLGIKVPEAVGEYRREAIVIDYVASGRSKSITLPAELTVCVGMDPVEGDFTCAAR